MSIRKAVREAAAKPVGPAEVQDLRTDSGAPTTAERQLERALGSEIRRIRRQQDLTVADLAAAAGISAGMLSKIENGHISPSLGTLQTLAGALRVSFTSLFGAFEERRDCSFVKSGQGLGIERRGTKVGHVYELLGHVHGGNVVVEPYLITLTAEAETYTAFQHAGTELIHMLEGEVVYRHGERSYRLQPGDTLMFDAGALHGPEALVLLPCVYLSIIVFERVAG